MNTPKPSFAVVGPAGSGKSKHAVEIADCYGRSNIVDEYVPGSTVEKFDHLYLSQFFVPGINNYSLDEILGYMEGRSL